MSAQAKFMYSSYLPKLLFNLYAIFNPKKSIKKKISIICKRFTLPEAIGLFLFSGCFWSFFASKKSFNIYCDDETKHNAKNPMIDIINKSILNKFPEKINGKNIKKFLYHCWILNNCINIFKKRFYQLYKNYCNRISI